MKDRWPVLLVAAGLLIAGGWQAVVATDSSTPTHVIFGAGVLMGAGLAIVAQWAALELRGKREEV